MCVFHYRVFSSNKQCSVSHDIVVFGTLRRVHCARLFVFIVSWSSRWPLLWNQIKSRGRSCRVRKLHCSCWPVCLRVCVCIFPSISHSIEKVARVSMFLSRDMSFSFPFFRFVSLSLSLFTQSIHAPKLWSEREYQCHIPPWTPS